MGSAESPYRRSGGSLKVNGVLGGYGPSRAARNYESCSPARVSYWPPRPPTAAAGAVGAGGRNFGSSILVISSLAASKCAFVS
jgi:hypothetical protein